MKGIYLRQAWRHFREGAGPHLFGLCTIALAFFLFSLFLMFVENFEALMARWQKRVQIVCYLKTGLSEAAVKELRRRALQEKGVSSVRYISPQEAKEELLKRMGEVAQGLEEMAEELFPACLEVSLRRGLGLQAVEALAGRLQRLKGVEEVQYGGRWLQRARALLRLLKGTIWILGGILLLVTLFITANTLRLIFYRRQEEVEILRLVGATEGFIRYPFLIEGALQGLLGAGISVVLLALLHPFISMALGSQAIPYLPSFRFLSAPALLSLLSLGFLSGLIGGAISCTGS